MRVLMLILPLLCLAGCGTPSFLVTPVANTNQLQEEEVEPGKGWFPPKIAVIPVEGMLVNARSGGFLQPTENGLSLFVQELNRAKADPAVKAVVLRVNSPGGTVTTSDAMYDLLRRFRKDTHKPVVASIQEVGASGAYYLSCGADKIVAQPTSIVGSVGVIFETLEFSGTLDKLGIRNHAIESGSLKSMGSPFKPLEPHEEKVMQEMVEEYFGRFVSVVRENRTITEPPVPDLSEYRKGDYAGTFSGRVFSGDAAMKLGLVDQTGLLEDAITLARKLAGLETAKVVMYRRPYGYGGTIYAESSTPKPNANVSYLELPGTSVALPAGFYYLWRPGL